MKTKKEDLIEELIQEKYELGQVRGKIADLKRDENQIETKVIILEEDLLIMFERDM